ncbi:LacI family DNA-binding transcriptional regulator [Brevibacterium album]|uniref:LacI family DNA-binding transcriptional regulator n=1 Tax=Brevibacterium album TaxID=417948 RepID=UPI000688CBF9|nr:LacI family DNA-binding transcriptional regulator [Brevibacterium album]
MSQQDKGVRRRPPRVTIKDVAQAAGVSPSTVSHAYSGRRAISAKTRERVFAAAEALGYSADPHARSMRTGSSGMIGLVLRPRFAATGAPEASETFNRLAGSMATECLRRGIGLVHVPDPSRPDYAAVPMDGCIIAHPYAGDPMIDLLASRGIPVVCADPDPDRPDLPWTAGVDYAEGMRAVFDALGVEAGAKVWLMPGSEDNAWNRAARSVHAEWCAGRGAVPEVHVLSEALSSDEARACVAGLLDAEGAPAALVHSLSKLTGPVMEALSAAGLAVPADVRLATLTDSSFARAAHPPVTALDLNHEGLAAAAVDLLLDRIAGGSPPAGPIRVRPQLNVRESTQP